ncbi:MAG TPA: cytochrome c3 family protein [Dissulfurispiraceae bacterium]|nr:cytochrome c3 family protein [Dissulfurispiraceae bacterium]
MIRSLAVISFIFLLLPALSFGAAKKHPPITAEQDCEECHDSQAQVWQDSKHGLMGVKCVVCHGDPNKNFVAKPTSKRCVGCHSEQVAGTAENHKMKQKNCWTCHNGHSLKPKSAKQDK